MLLTYAINAINNRFNMDIPTEKSFSRCDDSVECDHHCLVTQDWDELNEFIYTRELAIPDTKRPVYFTPQSNYGLLIWPKIKIRWAFRAKQIKLGQKLYNILEGTWEAGAFVPKLEVKSKVKVKLFPYQSEEPLTSEGEPAIVLIPFKNYTNTSSVAADIPTFSIADENVTCVYGSVHYSVSFNRQGLYINRKYRDKVEQVTPENLPENYIIIEPETIHISFSNIHNLKINLT